MPSLQEKSMLLSLLLLFGLAFAPPVTATISGEPVNGGAQDCLNKRYFSQVPDSYAFQTLVWNSPAGPVPTPTLPLGAAPGADLAVIRFYQQEPVTPEPPAGQDEADLDDDGTQPYARLCVVTAGVCVAKVRVHEDTNVYAKVSHFGFLFWGKAAIEVGTQTTVEEDTDISCEGAAEYNWEFGGGALRAGVATLQRNEGSNEGKACQYDGAVDSRCNAVFDESWSASGTFPGRLTRFDVSAHGRVSNHPVTESYSTAATLQPIETDPLLSVPGAEFALPDLFETEHQPWMVTIDGLTIEWENDVPSAEALAENFKVAAGLV